MKLTTASKATFLIVLLASPVTAQPTSVLEVGPHHNVLEWSENVLNPAGELETVSHQYTELATGLNYVNPKTGQWEESVPEFEITREGYAVARRGQHKVIIAPNINQGGSVDMELPDGQRMLSNPMGLSYFDSSSGKNVLLAEVKDCVGELVAPNVIVFYDAFDGVKASLRYTYTRAGFEQDVILHQDPGPPEAYGLDPAASTLEIYSEFYEAPEPILIRNQVAVKESPLSEGLPQDELRGEGMVEVVEGLSFGPMRIERGRAFFLNQEFEGMEITPTWEEIEGRKFLIETVPYREAEPMLENLQAQLDKRQQAELAKNTVVGRSALIEQLEVRSEPVQLAAITPSERSLESGLVLDYLTLNSSLTNYVFECDETYYVTDRVYLYETPVFEAGTVVKYQAPDPGETDTWANSLWINDDLDWRADAYRPVIFTSKDDNSVGATISGSTGSPSGTYARGALVFNYPDRAMTIDHFRIRNAYRGMWFSSSYTYKVKHAQFVDNSTDLITWGATLRLQNLLHSGTTVVGVNVANGGTAAGEHLTCSEANAVGYPADSLTLTNSLFVSVTNFSSPYSILGAHNSTNSSASVFQTSFAGECYLAEGSSYRDAGSSGLSPGLVAELGELTTYPPLTLSTPIDYPTTLAPVVARDNDADLDLGYHYTPLDYIASNVVVEAAVTFTNGVAVGTCGSYGFKIQTSSPMAWEGKPAQMNRLVHLQNVQEQGGSWGAGTQVYQTSGSYSPDVSFRFTEICGPPGKTGTLFGQAGSYPLAELSFQDCYLRAGYLSLYPNSSSSSVVVLLNNVIERSSLAINKSYYSVDTPLSANLYNNLFRGGSLTLYYDSGTSNPYWYVKDNLFDEATQTLSGNSSSSRVLTGYNGFTSGTSNSLGGSSNQTGLTDDFVSGPLGDFYYPATGGGTSLTNLVNAGSRAADSAGLYHYETTVEIGKKTTNQVDIGFHYVAADYAAATNLTGLLAHWKLDDGTGSTAVDSSTNSYTGTLYNGPTWGSLGRMSGALDFDGSNDYVDVPNSVLNSRSDLTASFWLKTARTGAQAVLSGANSGNNNEYLFFFGSSTVAFFYTGESASSYVSWSIESIADNSWHHFALVRDDTNNEATLYVDGEAQSTESTTLSTLTVDANGFVIGQEQDSVGGGFDPNQAFSGTLDDVRIYSRVLSGEEIGSIATMRLLDYDGDGLPDYFEDRDGDGSQDTGETDWEESENGTTGVTGLQVFPPME